MGQFHMGDVVYAEIADPHGRLKLRPCVIVSADDDNDAGLSLLLVAITGCENRTIPSYHIFVHNKYGLDPLSGLIKPCYAKCNWYRNVDQSRVQSPIGEICDAHLTEILIQLNRILDDPDFGDWM